MCETLSSRGIKDVIKSKNSDFVGEIGLICRVIIDAVYSYLYGTGEEKKSAESWIFSKDQYSINSFDNLLFMLNIDIDPDAAREALLRHIPDRKPFVDKRVRRWNYVNEGKNKHKRGRRTGSNPSSGYIRYLGCDQEINWIQRIFDQSFSE